MSVSTSPTSAPYLLNRVLFTSFNKITDTRDDAIKAAPFRANPEYTGSGDLSLKNILTETLSSRTAFAL